MGLALQDLGLDGAAMVFWWQHPRMSWSTKFFRQLLTPAWEMYRIPFTTDLSYIYEPVLFGQPVFGET